MIKKLLYLLPALAIVGCSSDDLTADHADGYDVMTFSLAAGTETSSTSSTITEDYITYVPYDYDRDPHTIGVFGYSGLDLDNPIFNNVEVTYNNETIPTGWEYTDKVYWYDYAMNPNLDFFGYMPHVKYNDEKNNVKVEQGTDAKSNEYTLSFPVSLEVNGESAPFSTSETALVCHKPVHIKEAYKEIPFHMDQTLTAFQLQFRLGTSMSSIRSFKIKKVTMSGSAGISGTVKRTYTLGDDGTWKAGDISWNDIKYMNDGGVNLDPVEIPCQKSESTTESTITSSESTTTTSELTTTTSESTTTTSESTTESTTSEPTTSSKDVLDNSDIVDWGAPFYVIPTNFAPTFTVTYDVVVIDENNQEIITRKDVTSTIDFTKVNFSDYEAGTMGTVYPLLINIVPDYLYVLADADQKLGYVVVNEAAGGKE